MCVVSTMALSCLRRHRSLLAEAAAQGHRICKVVTAASSRRRAAGDGAKGFRVTRVDWTCSLCARVWTVDH